VLNLHLVMTQAFGQAQRWGLLPSNPVSGAQPPRPRRKEPVVVDAPTATKLIELVKGTSLAVPVVLALSTGMRRGEILGLRWSDVASDLSALHVRRSLQIHAHATLMLLQGVHPKVVSERLSHASIGITLDTYSHVLPSMQAEPVGVRRAVPPDRLSSFSLAMHRRTPGVLADSHLPAQG